MITMHFLCADEPPTMNYDPEIWQCFYDQFHLPKEFSNLHEAIETIDKSIVYLVEVVGRDDYLDNLYWGLRLDTAPAFFHVTSFKDRYQKITQTLYEIQT